MDKMEITIDTVRRANLLAKWAHDGQVYYSSLMGDMPYIDHARNVVQRCSVPFMNYDNFYLLASVAWLHDVVEDSPITQEVIDFSFPVEVANAVAHITRDSSKWTSDNTYQGYIQRLSKNQTALTVKIYDLQENLSHCFGMSPSTKLFNQYTRYTKALTYLSGLASELAKEDNNA